MAQSDYSTDQPRQLRAYPINDDGSLGSYTTLHTFGIDHRRRPSVPCSDGPHRLDNVAVTSILERLRCREIVDIQP